MGSAPEEVKFLFDQPVLYVDAKAFQKIIDWMDAAATPAEITGMRRILDAKLPWCRDWSVVFLRSIGMGQFEISEAVEDIASPVGRDRNHSRDSLVNNSNMAAHQIRFSR